MPPQAEIKLNELQMYFVLKRGSNAGTIEEAAHLGDRAMLNLGRTNGYYFSRQAALDAQVQQAEADVEKVNAARAAAN
eukprot:gene2081-18263_t